MARAARPPRTSPPRPTRSCSSPSCAAARSSWRGAGGARTRRTRLPSGSWRSRGGGWRRGTEAAPPGGCWSCAAGTWPRRPSPGAGRSAPAPARPPAPASACCSGTCCPRASPPPSTASSTWRRAASTGRSGGGPSCGRSRGTRRTWCVSR